MKKRTVFAVISVLLIFTCLFSVKPSVGKYTTSTGEQSEITSENFYFTSDYLKVKADGIPEPKYEIYGDSVTFEVRNYIDSLRINQSDIDYTVTATEGNLKKADETVIDANTELTLAGGAKNSDSITLTYDFSVNNEAPKEITVTVNSTDMYAKELKAKFILLKPNSLAYEIKDKPGRNYAELYIYMGNTAQNVSLSWDNAVLVIDETNDYVFGKLNDEKNSVPIENIAADTTVKIVFFKKNINENHTCNVTKSNGTITIS